MAYKTGFQPMERLGRDGWRRFDDPEGATGSDRRLIELPTRRDRRRLMEA